MVMQPQFFQWDKEEPLLSLGFKEFEATNEVQGIQSAHFQEEPVAINRGGTPGTRAIGILV